MITKAYSPSLLKHIFVGLGLTLCRAKVISARELIYGIENEIKDYNISRSLDKNAFSLAELVTEGLFYQRPDGSLAPDLVKEFKRTGKFWTFELRNSQFSNGKTLSCEDVMANIDEARLSPRAVRARLKDIESVSCVAGVLKIETKQEAPQLLGRMGHVIRVYDVATLKDKNPIGSGPYFIEKKEGKDIVLLPNPHFPGIPKFEKIRYRALRDPWLRDLALLSGNVDLLMESFAPVRVKAFEQKPEVKIFRNPGNLLFFLVLKASKYSREQRLVFREVLKHVNTVKGFWASQVQPASTIFRETEAQVAGGDNVQVFKSPLTLEVSVVSDDTQINYLRELAKSFAPYNIHLKLRPLEYVTFQKRLSEKNYEAYFSSVDTTHPQNLEALLFSKSGRLELGDSELDQNFVEITKTGERAKLVALMAKIDQKNASEAYLLPLYRPFREMVIASKLNFQQGEDGFWRDLLK